MEMDDEDPERIRNLIDQMVSSCVAKGYVNDKLLLNKRQTLRRSGGSRIAISRKLMQRGVN